MADDLVSRVREFAAGYGAVVVSSAYLSAELDVDVRTIAAALRRHGVRSRDVGDTRGYVVDELVALPGGAEVDPPAGVVAATQALADDWRNRYVMNPEPSAIEVALPSGEAGIPNHWSTGLSEDEVKAVVARGNIEVGGLAVAEFDGQAGPVDAIAALSAGAGHDMTPALKAAGLL